MAKQQKLGGFVGLGTNPAPEAFLERCRLDMHQHTL